MAGKVAVREDAVEFSLGGDDHRSSRAAGRHAAHRVEHGVVGREDGQFGNGPHDLVDAQQQAASEAAARMEAREVLLLKPAGFEQGHRERIAEHEHGRGARTGREIERAGFLGNFHVQHGGRSHREGRTRLAGDRQDRQTHADERREHREQFLGFPAVTQRQDDIALRHHAEVAVQGIQGIQDHGGRAGAGEGRGDFLSDVPGFSDAEHHDFPPVFDGGLDQVHRLREIFAQAGTDCGGFLKFDIENLSGTFEIIHRSTMRQPRAPCKAQTATGSLPTSS